MKLLITAGATREAIDQVRFLSNVSTGRTGATLTELLTARGHHVTLLRGEGSAVAASVSDQEVFSSASDLSARLKRRLSADHYAVVIMTAAVSDYRPLNVEAGKLSSDPAELSLTLVRNEKILPQLKSFSRQPLHVIGFKLTVNADANEQRAAVARQFQAGGVDAVVHNDLSAIRAAPRESHPFTFFDSPSATGIAVRGTSALADALVAFLMRSQTLVS
jgi:phosphopantothenoylcysteine synthetase/decarboxylase